MFEYIQFSKFHTHNADDTLPRFKRVVIIYPINIQRLFSVVQQQYLFNLDSLHFPAFIPVLSIIRYVIINAGIKIRIMSFYLVLLFGFCMFTTETVTLGEFYILCLMGVDFLFMLLPQKYVTSVCIVCIVILQLFAFYRSPMPVISIRCDDVVVAERDADGASVCTCN